MDSWKRIKEGEKEYWKWGNYVSKSYEFLEERPWTPLIIGDQLCFTAKNNEKYRVVWGEYEYQEFDDVYDTDECKNKPVYIARDGASYHIVHDDNISQSFDFQIKYAIENNVIKVYKFADFVKGKIEALQLNWDKITNR